MKIRMPTIAGLNMRLPFTLYAWRLRTRAAQELLAAAGIAVGVALVFGVLVANASIEGSVSSLVHQLVGSAQLQLAARSQEGFSQALARRAQTLPGVQATSPLLLEDIAIVGPHGSEPIQLIGVTAGQLALGAVATRDLGSGAPMLISGGVGLPSSVAETIGAHPDQTVFLRANGKLQPVRVGAVLGGQTIGAIAASPVAIALLKTAQRLTGYTNRVTNVLVEVRPGSRAKVDSELRALAGNRINVTPADNELRLLEVAVKPNRQSTTLFAAIAGMVGFLLALNAMLLTVPERRRFVAELRTYGYDPAQIILLLAVQALILGVIGSVIGIALGDILAHTLFGQIPSYLTAAFPIGSERLITTSTVAIAVACGILAALLASVRPLFDLRAVDATDTVTHEQGEAGQSIPGNLTVTLALGGCALIVIVTVLALVAPRLTIVGGVLLAIVAVCLVPIGYAATLAALGPLSERSKGVLSIAVVELEATATRSIAVAAIAALAVYGSLAIGGARADLTHGLEGAIAQYERTADIWVTTGANVFNTDSFHPRAIQSAIERAPGVAAVRADQGALLDVGDNLMMIRVHSPKTATIIQSSQLVQGNLAHASELIRDGGWATISDGFATERGLHVGAHFRLPTPSGSLQLGVAAITTNLGWPAGAITLSSADYLHGWKTDDPSAFEINLGPGVTTSAGKRAVQAALGRNSGLSVQTAHEREAQTDRTVRQGLSSLGEISTLLLVTGALAVAASLGAAIWQRRARLAAMKTWGYDQFQLWRSLLLESVILLVVGCANGAVLGIYGHALADRWLRLTTDFPAPFSVGATQVLLTFALVVGIALAVLAAPGLSAARVSPSLSFQE